MADLILGTQGSGKSYYAVHKISKEQAKYSVIYTNIADFKYSANIKKLNPTLFFNTHVKPLYDTHKKDNNVSDLTLKRLFYGSLGLEEDAKMLLVLDEAHNYIGKKNDVLQWFMTYHRHLNVDYLVITQILTSISLDNRIFNNIIFAYPTSRQFLPNRIRYKSYLSLPLSDSNLNRKFSIKKEKSVFDLYHSGGIIKTDKSSIKFYLIFLLSLLLFVFFGFQYFLKNYGIQDSKAEPKDEVISPTNSNLKSEAIIVSKNTRLYDYLVIYDEQELFCPASSKSAPLKLLPKPIHISSHGYGFVRYYYNFPLQFCSSDTTEEQS